MKLLLLALLCVIVCLCGANAAYLSIHDQKQPWAGLQEGLMTTPALDELDSQYLCDVTIANEAFQISVHSTNSDDWATSSLDGRALPHEYISVIDQHLRSNFAQPGAPSSTSDRAHSSPLMHSSASVISPSISCRRPAVAGSALQRRIGFMHIIDLLSIIGVGFLAATASGVAAFLRRHDHHHNSATSDLPPFLQLDHLHERPNSDETEYVLDYIKSKLG